ncbi:centromere protein Q-like isoform X2 [Anneissia japonica]|uniref:centromere protein Q-like isoform X2 n=1 Tax=Anneissia japonica TaxID=1529436 RepID=UPI0014259AE2|nr:centromere protein Q-like isoform X2 [Anneissia japonica]
MKSNGRTNCRFSDTGSKGLRTKTNVKKGSKEASSYSKKGFSKKPSVSAAAVKTHPVKRISGGDNIQTKTKGERSAEPYKERVISGKALSRWHALPIASQQHIIKVLENVICLVLNNTKGAVYEEVQTHLNQLKLRITRSLTNLKVPPVNDYKKLEEQCKLLEETLVETNNQSECLDEEIEKMEMEIEEKEQYLANLEREANEEESNGRYLHPALESTYYTNQLGLPSLSNPTCYFGGIQHMDDDVQRKLLQSLSKVSTSNSSQEISTLLNQLGP